MTRSPILEVVIVSRNKDVDYIGQTQRQHSIPGSNKGDNPVWRTSHIYNQSDLGIDREVLMAWMRLNVGFPGRKRGRFDDRTKPVGR